VAAARKAAAPRGGTKNAQDAARVSAPVGDERVADAGVPVEPAARTGPLPLPMDLLRRAIEDASDEQGWAQLGGVGSYLTKIRPDFDPRLYGHRKLSDLVRAHPRHFTLEERGGAGGSRAIFVRALA
ncbi:MAG: OST-HTH/LOTUS domain-containing protein, partial [Pseudomonadota bacterium]|nr:OST-HTH/LOTUS domain-containing protein [Pseudomonadota bacterium]